MYSSVAIALIVVLALKKGQNPVVVGVLGVICQLTGWGISALVTPAILDWLS